MNSSETSIEISQGQRDFIQACAQAGVLKFDPNNGFRLKSGRQSPWFFQAGELMKDAKGLAMLGRIYVDALLRNFSDGEGNISGDALYGPAYKGIPLAAVAAAEYYIQTGKNIGFASHRKEEKDHGEKGKDFGTKMTNKSAILLDDVMTAGTAIKGSKIEIETDGGFLSGAVVLLDRQEVQNEGDNSSALAAISRDTGIKIVAALDYKTVRQAVAEGLIGSPEVGAAMDSYFKRYGT